MDLHKLAHDLQMVIRSSDFSAIAFLGFLHRPQKQEGELSGLDVSGDNFPQALISNPSLRKRGRFNFLSE